MRLNKRLILKAPKRGPGELEAELAILKRSPKYLMRKLKRVGNAVVTCIRKVAQQCWDCITQILKPIVDAVTNYTQYTKEDEMLFCRVPSIRRFEKDMI